MRRDRMRNLTLILLLAVAACHRNSPIADKGTEPPANMVGDNPANGLGAPANAAAAEAEDRASAPAATDGMGWSMAAPGSAQGGVSYGPAPDTPMLSFACQTTGIGRSLSVVRHDSAPSNGIATMSLTGSGHVASLPMKAQTMAGMSGAMWTASVRSDEAAAVARTFAQPGTVEISVGGTSALRVPADPRVRELLYRCAGL